MEPVVDRMIPGARRYLVTGFVGTGASPRDEKTSLHLPIRGPRRSSVPRSVGEHVVVYFNDKADAERLRALAGLGVPFHVYGTGARVESVQGSVTVKPMGPGFLGYSRVSRAVIAGAGFTTMTEAIYLGKPMLAVPFEGQYEQILNASYLSEMGYGEGAKEITREGVGAFLSTPRPTARTSRGWCMTEIARCSRSSRRCSMPRDRSGVRVRAFVRASHSGHRLRSGPFWD